MSAINTDLPYERGMILFQQGRYADAERELRGSLAQDPHNPFAHAMLALCLVEQKNWAAATAEADQAAGLAPDFPFAHYVRGRVLHGRERHEEAEAAVAEAIRLDSTNPDYFWLAGVIQYERRRWAAALALAEQGLAADPEHAGCVNLRAMALVQLGRRGEAGQAIGAALARDPDNAVTHSNQGWALLHQGDHKKALEHFREALRLEPELEWARAGIVEALKARNPVYRLLLRYFLWMSRLSSQAQWGLIIGVYLAQRVLRVVADNSPELAPIARPLLYAFIGFVYLTWIADPLFNLLLRASRFGRYALSREQTVASNWIGAALLGAVGFGVAWVVTREIETALAAGYFALMAIPLSATFRCPKGWPRHSMALYTAGVGVCGALALVLLVVLPVGPRGLPLAVTLFGGLFLLGIFLGQWVANALVMARVRK